jgi:protocatechuate 4,5-dioxygenase beta chain
VGKIVGGFLVPHDPVMFAAPEAPSKEQRDYVWGAFAECAKRLADLEPTSVIIVGADHYILFGTACLPHYLIGIGDVDGSIEPLPGLKRGTIPNSSSLARHISESGQSSGFDWAVARALTVDHAVGIPNQLLVDPARTAGAKIGTIPVYLASGVDPYIRLSRAAQLGSHIAEAIATFPADERVVVVGSGGISHWVGTAEMGKVNPDFDKEILGYAEQGNLAGLCSLTDDYILKNGGNGGMEIRNFACAMGAVRGRGEIVAYAPVREWVTGLGFVQLYA